MKKVIPLLAIGTLLLWGGMFLYFYLSGRVEKYLDPSFRIYALISGIGFLLLGAFNFLNREIAASTCCGHDHDHDHGHDHEGACGGHGHHHGCGHDHDHDHHHGCDHDHGHGDAGEHGHGHGHGHDHAHEQGCCGHDHHSEEEHHHHHHDDSPSGVLVALLILIVPLLVTAAYSKDQFSSGYLSKWGKIERQMMQMRIAKEREGVGNGAAPVTNPYTSEGIAAAEGAAGADTPPDPSKAAAGGEAPAWGTFTMEDLKKMVPQNDKGEFLLDIPQIFYTAGDRELMQVMEGIPVEATAQLMEETLHNPNKTRLKAFRLFIECCAADARPLSIPIDFGKAPPEYTEMGWYKIYGKLHYANENEEIIPLLQVERIEQTSEPTDGLLF